MSRSIFLGAATIIGGNGGIARVARISARALADAGHILELASFLDEKPVGVAGFPVWSARGSKLRFAARSHRAALNSKGFLYDSAGIARAHPLIPGLRRRYAVWMHGIEAWQALKPQAERRLRGAALVLVNSEFTLDRFRQLHGDLPAARVCWLATEEDDGEVAPRRSGPPTALILGKIMRGCESYKGHAELISAWPQIVARVPDARLLIAGDGPGLSELVQRINGSPAAGNIDVLGFVPEDEVGALWRRASVFAMPSRGEGFGLVYVEAMRYGIPVIASTEDAAQEVNLDGETGFNASLDDPGQLADRLIRLLHNPDLGIRMGRAGQRRWREHFSFQAFKNRFVPLFASFLNQERDLNRKKRGGSA